MQLERLPGGMGEGLGAGGGRAGTSGVQGLPGDRLPSCPAFWQQAVKRSPGESHPNWQGWSSLFLSCLPTKPVKEGKTEK